MHDKSSLESCPLFTWLTPASRTLATPRPRVRPGAHKVGVIIAYSRSINKVLVAGNLLDDRHQITMSREGGMKT